MELCKTVFRSLVLSMLFACGLAAQPSEADRILGQWFTPKKDAIFEFFREENAYHARLITLDTLDVRDNLNPVDSLRGRKIKNMVIVANLVYNQHARQWENGTVYNPRNGKTYSCQCSLWPDQNKMKFRGYIGFSALGGTRIFSRVNR